MFDNSHSSTQPGTRSDINVIVATATDVFEIGEVGELVVRRGKEKYETLKNVPRCILVVTQMDLVFHPNDDVPFEERLKHIHGIRRGFHDEVCRINALYSGFSGQL